MVRVAGVLGVLFGWAYTAGIVRILRFRTPGGAVHPKSPWTQVAVADHRLENLHRVINGIQWIELKRRRAHCVFETLAQEMRRC